MYGVSVMQLFESPRLVISHTVTSRYSIIFYIHVTVPHRNKFLYNKTN